MWDISCSGNTQKTNLLQFFEVVHWATPGSLLEKFEEKNFAIVSILKLLTKENFLVCLH